MYFCNCSSRLSASGSVVAPGISSLPRGVRGAEFGEPGKGCPSARDEVYKFLVEVVRFSRGVKREIVLG